MARTKRLPKGLAEFEGSLSDLEYAPRLLPRLHDLPESNLRELQAKFDAAMAKVAEAEAKAKYARNVARTAALVMWRAARQGWSVKELQEATGYDDE